MSALLHSFLAGTGVLTLWVCQSITGSTASRTLQISRSLSIVPGMTVVRHDHLTAEKANKDWWMGELIHCGGAARDPSIHNLFQIADGDSGVISWVNADLVTHILPSDN